MNLFIKKIYWILAILSILKIVCAEDDLLLPVWNHPTEIVQGGPIPQATACASVGHIALTYNEGPSDVTAKVLNGLKANQAKANFFVNATWLYTQQYAMMLQRAYNDGHFIGMTYRAPSDSTKGLTDDQIKADVTNTAKIIETLIGVAPKYIRLHYSEPENTRLEGIIHDLGYVLVGYNLDTADYNFKNNPSGIANVYKDTFFKQMETYDSKGSFISVQYDIPDTGSYQAIYDVIKTINDNGYTMVRLDGCLNDKEPYKEHAASKKFVNDKHSLGQANYKLGQIAAEKPAELIDPQVQEEDQMVKDMTEKVSASTTNTFEWSHLGFALSAVIYVLFF